MNRKSLNNIIVDFKSVRISHLRIQVVYFQLSYRIMSRQLHVRNAILNFTYIEPSKDTVRTFALRHKNKTFRSSWTSSVKGT